MKTDGLFYGLTPGQSLSPALLVLYEAYADVVPGRMHDRFLSVAACSSVEPMSRLWTLGRHSFAVNHNQ